MKIQFCVHFNSFFSVLELKNIIFHSFWVCLLIFHLFIFCILSFYCISSESAFFKLFNSFWVEYRNGSVNDWNPERSWLFVVSVTNKRTKIKLNTNRKKELNFSLRLRTSGIWLKSLNETKMRDWFYFFCARWRIKYNFPIIVVVPLSIRLLSI